MLVHVAISVVGASHQRSGTPCQDAAFVECGAFSGLATVADGHGSKNASRSDRGALFATEIALSCLRSYLHGDAKHGVAPDQIAIQEDLPPCILDAWRKRVAKDLAEVPDESDLTVASYGTTLLAAAWITNSPTPFVILVQIGDGNALLHWRDGSVTEPLRPTERMLGVETWSLAESDQDSQGRSTRGPLAHFQTCVLRADDLTGIALATDGVANSFIDEQGFYDFVSGCLDTVTGQEPATAKSWIRTWLEELSTKGSGDDASLALLVPCQNHRKTMDSDLL